MRNTTLCYIENDGKYLMLHRISKEKDVNQGKWVGVGGKFEEDESPDVCIIREAREETGFTLQNPRCRGVVTFLSNQWETEHIYLFTADQFTGTLSDCDEGRLCWIRKEEVGKLNVWEGDRIFLRLLLEDAPFFLLTLQYDGDDLIFASLNGEIQIDRRPKK